jgi:hypothetical protein
VRPAAVRTSPSSLQIFTCLSRDYKILHACQQRFALGQIHAKRFHRQLPPLDRQDLPALLAAVVAYANDLHPDLHGCTLQCCAN